MIIINNIIIIAKSNAMIFICREVKSKSELILFKIVYRGDANN